ncbi:MAG TPA: hypothetical protein VGP24_04240 [Glaciihabitans sp.]|jgi:type IV secretory pathway TrbL component|nr:hypothetical protein [Glaciihabitans sp.]
MTTTPNAPQPTTTAPAKKKVTRFITPALVIIAVLGIGIYGGVLIGQNTASASTAAGGFGGDRTGMTAPDGAAGGTGAMGGMGGLTTGTVVSVDGTTMVIEDADGEQVTVTTTDDTSVTATSDTTLDALTEGDSVTIVGEADDTGEVAATSISEGASTGFPGQAPTE